jgi:RNA polymerase sigma-70 factor, ECF subfamily
MIGSEIRKLLPGPPGWQAKALSQTRTSMAAFATVAQVTTPRPSAAGTTWDLLRTGVANHNRVPGNILDLEASLVERCLNGEESAWEDLVKVYTKRVYSICYRFTGSDSEAQDLTQDVFLRVFKTLRSFRAGEGSFVVWLTRLSRNLLIDNYRRTRLERASDSIEEQLTGLEDRSTGYARADGLVAGREASEILQSALQKLSPELRETVILRDLEEMDYREIANVLNVPEGTVKSRLNRGRAELARILRKQKVAL